MTEIKKTLQQKVDDVSGMSNQNKENKGKQCNSVRILVIHA